MHKLPLEFIKFRTTILAIYLCQNSQLNVPILYLESISNVPLELTGCQTQYLAGRMRCYDSTKSVPTSACWLLSNCMCANELATASALSIVVRRQEENKAAPSALIKPVPKWCYYWFCSCCYFFLFVRLSTPGLACLWSGLAGAADVV